MPDQVGVSHSAPLTPSKQPFSENLRSVIVIGAGFGGIAAALRMRALGYDVTLIDRLDAIGGRAQVFERGGFRHDAGPTVITAPFLFDELFALFGERREDHVEFRALDPWYRFYFHTGEQFDYRPSIEDTNEEIRRFSPQDVAGYAGCCRCLNLFLKLALKNADKPLPNLLICWYKSQAYCGCKAIIQCRNC